MKAEAKQLKAMEQSMDEMTSLSGNREQYYNTKRDEDPIIAAQRLIFFFLFLLETNRKYPKEACWTRRCDREAGDGR